MAETIDTQICIVGAGPAGAVTSIVLGKMGIPHLIVDASEFPRDKICGDGLDLKVVRVLNNIDPSIVKDEFSKNDFTQSMGMRFILPKGKQVDLVCKADGNTLFHQPLFYTAPRTFFDEFLVNKIDKRFGDIRTGCKIDSILRMEGHWLLEGEMNEGRVRIKTKLLVGADGDHSVVLKSVSNRKIDRKNYAAAIRQYWKGIDGIDEKKLIEIYFPERYPFAYFWIFPFSGDEANIGFGMASHQVAKKNINIRKALEDILQNDPHISHRFKSATPLEHPKGWGIPMSTAYRNAHGDGWLLTGDAASLVCPKSGEGIGPAMLSGYIAAHYIERALKKNSFSKEMFSGYDAELHKRSMNEERLFRFANAMPPSVFVKGISLVLGSSTFKKWYSQKEMKRWLITAYEKPIKINFSK